MAIHTTQFIVMFDDKAKYPKIKWPGTGEKLSIPWCECCKRQAPEVKRFLIVEGLSLCAECIELDLKRMKDTEDRSERNRSVEK